LEKEVEVNEADGLRYGRGGGREEEKLPFVRSESTRLRLRFFMMRGIRLKLVLVFFESTVFPGWGNSLILWVELLNDSAKL
jgi:hypothetical protein